MTKKLKYPGAIPRSSPTDLSKVIKKQDEESCIRCPMPLYERTTIGTMLQRCSHLSSPNDLPQYPRTGRNTRFVRCEPFGILWKNPCNGKRNPLVKNLDYDLVTAFPGIDIFLCLM
jgi:hypothetical protein